MSYRKHGRGLLGLLVVAVLGVMAFAGSAQGVAPKFNVAGATAGDFEVTGVQEGQNWALLVPNSNLSLTCTEFEVLEGLVLTGGLVAHFKLLHKGCKAVEHKNAGELPCHVSDVAGGDATKLHVTANFLALPLEFADGKYGILVEKISAQINFLSGTGCPLPLKTVFTGEVCFKITSGNDTASPLIQSNQTIQGECPAVALEGTGSVAKDTLKFGANEAFVVGAAILSGKALAAGKTIGVLLL
jgi:hypothetical protein